ncbi:MAG TPA: adenylate/guanylate cyclase domain-containing protein [Steroidobacteraceae bacterium]|nr:adenylate/guanylate cyclase domain-containing protein [Steroidobacteraceae bacterium]
MIIFACLGAVTTAAVGRPVEIGAFNAVLIGAGIGLFEEFYVQGSRGNWMREMHPLRAIFIYVLVVIVLYLIAVHVTHLVLGRLDDLPVVYRRLPYGITFFTTFSIVGILMIRLAHFIGLRTLLDLVIGTYHRPVEERKVLLFLDINGSTALAERLGALTMRSFVRKFLSDLSQPIVDCGGEIYLYKGDGLIAVWNWADAVKADAILKAVDAMFATVAKQRDAYQRLFGAVPTFRIGIHGGPVIVSEQGDAKRSIGIYGDAINIAARMEEAARAHNARCVISEIVAQALADRSRVRPIGTEQVKGISAPVAICEYASA